MKKAFSGSLFGSAGHPFTEFTLHYFVFVPCNNQLAIYAIPC